MSKYVPYHAASTQYARQICVGAKSQEEKYKRITEYVSRAIGYDYIKAVTVAKKKNVLPDVAACWNRRMGICQDISAMTVGMLRAVGISAYLCIGHADKQYHAWVEAYVGGSRVRYDHDGKAQVYVTERVY